MDYKRVFVNSGTEDHVSKKVKWSVFLFSATLHLIIIFLFINIPIALDDMFQYDMLGRSLSSENGYRWYAKADVEKLKPYLESFMDIDQMVFPENGINTAFRAPGYPIFLALFYLFNSTQTRFALVRIIQAIIMALLAPMAIKTGEIIGLSKNRSILSGILVSLYPILLFYPIGLVSEDLFIPLFSLAILLSFLTARENKIWFYLIFGIVLGFLILTRSIAIVFAVIALAWLCFFSRLKFKGALVSALLVIAICLPWVIHNSKIMGKPASVENTFWYNMYIGYHPKGNGGFVSDIAIIPLFMTNDSERDEYCRNNAIAYIKANPLEAIKRVFTRVPDFFGPETREINYFYSNNLLGYIPPPWLEFIYLLLTLPWFMTSFFSLIGYWYSPNRVFSCLTVLFLSCYVFPHLLILAEPRFHLAMVPVLIPFAVSGIGKIRSISKTHQTNRLRIPILLIVLLLGLIAIWVFKISLDWSLVMKLLMPNGNLVGLSY